MNIFEKATRNAIRFETTRGNITVEDLWNLPLTSRGSNPSLDDIAKAINRQIKAEEEESFVVKASPKNSELSLKLDIVKHIISVKLEEAEKAKSASEIKAKREKLLELLEKKQDESLSSLSIEEIRSQLESLQG